MKAVHTNKPQSRSVLPYNTDLWTALCTKSVEGRFLGAECSTDVRITQPLFMSNMNWRYVTLHCPHCGFAHAFKRICWWEVDGVYIGLYGGDDMKARKSCEQQLLYGESTYQRMQNFNISWIEGSIPDVTIEKGLTMTP